MIFIGTNYNISGNNLKFCTDGCEMFPPSFVRQAKRSKELIYCLLCLAMLTSPALAYPSNKIHTFKEGNATLVGLERCRPVDPQHLRSMLGSSFDASRMALDDEGVKRAALRERSVDDDDEEESVLDSREIDIGESEIDSVSRRRQRKVQIKKWTDNPDNPGYLESMQYMRRRRSADEKDLVNEYDDDHDYQEDNDVTFYQKLMQMNVRKESHRRFKRAKSTKPFRKKNLLPWTCRMKTNWLEMGDGYFPQYIKSARCRSKKCYYRTKECIPKKYTIDVLRRDPNRCNPVPLTGHNSIYEEVWYTEKIHVTVWCECGNPRNKKKRRRNRGRSRP